MTCVVSSRVQLLSPPSRHKHGREQQQGAGGPDPSDGVECDLLKAGGPGLPQSHPGQLCPNLLPSSPVPPTEGQPVASSLVGNKYLILEPVEGSTLHRCINVHTQREYVCKASTAIYLTDEISSVVSRPSATSRKTLLNCEITVVIH
ncbi:hypothetical protein PR048_033203 [Dryococelus australis]|uniref:Uncharacterized protein n=1 Tax=Dryococelus australis TaxID=614101 RepID=A0ABQ9G0J7_9NEOP|nr:hypothetical protein PR048_033203 [Dryococelus australis]